MNSTTNMPNIASFVQYDIAGGHQLIVTGEVADWFRNGTAVAAADDSVAHTDELGWAVQAGANFNLADIATLTAGVGYGEGLIETKFGAEAGFNSVDAGGDPLEAIAFVVGLSFGLSETTTFNTQFSYFNALRSPERSNGQGQGMEGFGQRAVAACQADAHGLGSQLR